MPRKKSSKGEEEKRPQKSQQLILKHTEEAALTELNRSSLGLMLSGLSGGLDIGFSVLMMSVVLTLFNGVFPDAVVQVLLPICIPLDLCSWFWEDQNYLQNIQHLRYCRCCRDWHP